MSERTVRSIGAVLAAAMASLLVAIYSQPNAYQAAEVWSILVGCCFFTLVLGVVLVITGKTSW